MRDSGALTYIEKFWWPFLSTVAAAMAILIATLAALDLAIKAAIVTWTRLSWPLYPVFPWP
jgi:hypothetical protein